MLHRGAGFWRNNLNYEKVKFANNSEMRDVLVLLRMSGRTQTECANLLRTTRQAISIEEQEQRHSQRMKSFTSLVARAVLPECYHHIFPISEQNCNLEEIKYEI